MKFKKNNLRNLKTTFITFVCFILIASGLFLFVCEYVIRPTLKEYSISLAQNNIEKIINESVNELLNEYKISYSDIAIITRDQALNVSSIEIDVLKINLLKSGISKSIQNKLSSFNEFSLKIPVGTFTTNKYLLGRGPKVTFKMQLSVWASTDYESKFYEAGINQTLHQIIINVDCKAHIIMPPYNTNCDVSTSFIAAQSVIVGKVPESYTSVFEGEPSDITDAIFDYADSVSYSVND